ncbi:MAG: hypothetical protein HRT58_10860 [Crocinitomicaceae bacterium]|nr:hypothetical protein [Flavobacteriales bacterium]NQZ36155.1 hypothetical protein [Crocinitomicaceae bacterium]
MKQSKYILLFIFLLLGIVLKFSSHKNDNDFLPHNSTESIQANCYEEQKPTISGKHTTRSWQTKLLPNSNYCINYHTNDSDVSDAQNYRQNYREFIITTENDFWGALYESLYLRQKDLLLPLIDSLRSIKIERKLNRTEFANVVVAFVQDIPYSYILSPRSSCENRANKQYDCLPNQKFGLLSPIEFLSSLKGDCDTRTVLLYSILKELGYSPKIANSSKYLHSILLLDIPSTGDYLEHNHHRYYFWETTAKGWQSGDLPPGVNNVKYWEIVLY